MFGKDKKYNTKTVQLSNGCNIAYIDEGTGDKTLLFVHGLAGYCYTWALNIDELRKQYRCIAIDLPGNGYSDGGDYSYGINFFSGCVYDFMQQLSLQHVILVGHSMGGQIVLNLAIQHPTCCEGLILCATAGFETFSAMERSIYKAGIHFFDFFSTEENSLRRIIKTSFFHYPQQIDEMIQELVNLMHRQPIKKYRDMIEACIDGMISEPVFERLHTIQQPVLVIYGERDALIPNRLLHPTTTQHIAEEGVSQIPNATLKMIPKCGHFLQLEQPVTVNRYIQEFAEDITS